MCNTVIEAVTKCDNRTVQIIIKVIIYSVMFIF